MWPASAQSIERLEGSMEKLAQFIPTCHAGDFDRSGNVDAADYVYWLKTMGSPSISELR